MLQVHDQMMIDMVLRPLLLVLLVFFQNYLLDDTKGVVRQHDSQIPIAFPRPKASGGNSSRMECHWILASPIGFRSCSANGFSLNLLLTVM